MAFRLDLSKFKKVSAGKDHSVMRDPKGNEIKIAHSQLSPKLRGQLAELPIHLAEGGEVFEEEKPAPGPTTADVAAAAPAKAGSPIVINVGATPTAQPPQMPAAAPPQPAAQTPVNLDPMAMIGMGNMGAPEAPESRDIKYPTEQKAGPAPASDAPPVTQAPEAVVAPAPAVAATPQPTPAVQGGTPNVVQSGFRQAQAGIQSEANAEAVKAQRQAIVLEQSQAIQQQAMADYQQKVVQHEKEVADLMADFKAHKVDPERYMGSRTTGQKVGTAIGLILGGMGGGVLHQENPALKFINQQIDRDIEAQKGEGDKRKTLLNANMEQYKDAQVAFKMTQAMQLEMVATKLKTEEAKANDPIVKARAQKAIGELKMVQGAKLAEAAKLQTVNALVARMGGDPEQLPAMIAALRMIDPAKAEELQKSLVPGVGLANSQKDADYSKEVMDRRNNINARLIEVQNMIKDKGTYEMFGSHNADLDRKLDQIATDMAKLQDPESIARPGEVEMVKKNLSASGLWNRNSTALDTLKHFRSEVESAAKSKLQTRGLKLPGAQNLSPQQKSFVEWARKNPSDPRAKMILEKLGLE